METLIDIILLTFLAIIAIAITRIRHLFVTVILTGMFSLMSASLLVSMDAVDVAFTEAAVGAGISTLLFLSVLALTSTEELAGNRKFSSIAFILVSITGAILIYGTLDIPKFGDPSAPVHHHIAERFIYESPDEIGVPNMVTSVLASYRGYDTLGETTVILTAGIGVLLLLGRGKQDKETD